MIFCGQEEVDWEDPFPAEYDVEKAAAYIRGFNLQMAELKKQEKFLWTECHRSL